MIINKTTFYTSLEPSIKKNKSIIEFNQEFNKKYTNFKNVNLILDFSKNINIDLEEILLFLQKSTEHKKNKKSFVIVYSGMDLDIMNDELVIVPTFKEAEDVIEIEEIERDLGI